MQYIEPWVTQNLDKFRIVDANGNEVGEYWGTDPRNASYLRVARPLGQSGWHVPRRLRPPRAVVRGCPGRGDTCAGSRAAVRLCNRTSRRQSCSLTSRPTVVPTAPQTYVAPAGGTVLCCSSPGLRCRWWFLRGESGTPVYVDGEQCLWSTTMWFTTVATTWSCMITWYTTAATRLSFTTVFTTTTRTSNMSLVADGKDVVVR